MQTTTLPEGKPKEDHNPGQDEFDKIIERNISHGDERAMEERAKDGAIDDNIDSKGFSNKEEAPESNEEENDADEQEQIAQHENQVGRGYIPSLKNYKSLQSKEDKKNAKKWLFDKRKAAAGGGIAGTLIAIFGLFISQGPLQFVHIAQLMEQFHFSAQEDQSDDRFVKTARYIQYGSTGELEKTRLGVFQNKIADKIEVKMNATGIKSSYSQVFGFGDGYIIDPDKLATGEFKDLKGKTSAEIQAYFKETFNVDIKTKLPNGTSVPEGTFFAGSDGLGYFEKRKFTKTMVKAAGYNKVVGPIGARIMGKRAGVTWHPMKQLDNKILKSVEARYLAWKENRVADIKNGTQVGLETKSTPIDDTDPAIKEEAEKAAAAGNEALTDGKDVDGKVAKGDTGAISGFTNRLSVKVGIGGASAAGILCIAKGIDDNADQIKMKQVILPLIRMGMMAVTLGNQVMTGGKDVSTEQMGFFARQLNGKDSTGKKTTWMQAQSILAELGKTVNPNNKVGKPDTTLTTINDHSPFHFLNTGTFGSILGPVCSTPGTIAITAISFLGGPVSALTSTIVGAIAAGPIMHTIAGWISGNAVDPLPVGADYGNGINFGNLLASNAQGVSRGGRELSKDESLKIAAIQHDKSQREFQEKSIAYKLFNPYDYRSAVSKVIDQQSSDVTQNISNTANAMLNFGSVFSSLSNLLTSKASAYTPTYYDYGVPKVGFSVDEMNDEKVKNPFENACYVVGCHPTAAATPTPTPTPTPPTPAADNGICAVDYSRAPDLADAAQILKEACEANFTAIERLLGAPAKFPEPHKIIITSFKSEALQELGFPPTNDKEDNPAFAEVTHTGNTYINAEKLKTDPDPSWVMAHEDTHVIQSYGSDYTTDKAPFWVTEGMADYGAYQVTKKQEYKYKCTAANDNTYLQGYGCGSALLAYLVQKYDSSAVKDINLAIRAGTYRDATFYKQKFGKDLNTLYNECLQSVCAGGKKVAASSSVLAASSPSKDILPAATPSQVNITGILEDPGKRDDYIERAKKCFGVTIDPTTYDITDFQAGNPEYDDIADSKCTDKDANWERVRFYIFDTQNMLSAACYEGEDEACAAVGFAGSTPVTAAPEPGTTNNNVYLLGDSILEGAYYTTGYLKNKLDDNGWVATADASSGRSITTPGSDPDNDRPGHEQSGLQAIDTDAEAIKKAGSIVIELGTNTSGTASQFENQMNQVLGKIKPLNGSAKIYWVNIVSTSNPIYPSYNDIIKKVAGQQNVTVIDAESKNIALDAGHTHPSDNGYKEYSSVVSDELGKPVPAAAASGDVKDLATQILANTKITYPLDASSPNGSTKDVLTALSKGDKAPVTCPNAGVSSVDVNPNILKFLVDLGAQGKVGVNAITDKCHSSASSNHYKGKAVDFECKAVPFDTSKADTIAAKYGGKRNSESCGGESHWHYDFE